MTTSAVADALAAALGEIGVGRGDIVYVHSQVFGLGPIAAATDRDSLCADLLRGFVAAIGAEGTLVVPTFTTGAARRGAPFIRETTPADTGILCNHVRTRATAVRSLHPINSVAAYGPAAEAICENGARTNYGLDTPFDRMLARGAKAVNLGFPHRYSNSWHHYAEALLGMPYLYNKLLDLEVWDRGRRIDGPFFATLRYLDFGIANDLRRFDRDLLNEGLVRTVGLGRGMVSCIDARVYVERAVAALKRDPWYFLSQPPRFRKGEIPWDGAPERAGTA